MSDLVFWVIIIGVLLIACSILMAVILTTFHRDKPLDPVMFSGPMTPGTPAALNNKGDYVFEKGRWNGRYPFAENSGVDTNPKDPGTEFEKYPITGYHLLRRKGTQGADGLIGVVYTDSHPDTAKWDTGELLFMLQRMYESMLDRNLYNSKLWGNRPCPIIFVRAVKDRTDKVIGWAGGGMTVFDSSFKPKDAWGFLGHELGHMAGPYVLEVSGLVLQGPNTCSHFKERAGSDRTNYCPVKENIEKNQTKWNKKLYMCNIEGKFIYECDPTKPWEYIAGAFSAFFCDRFNSVQKDTDPFFYNIMTKVFRPMNGVLPNCK